LLKYIAKFNVMYSALQNVAENLKIIASAAPQQPHSKKKDHCAQVKVRSGVMIMLIS
jgi:hypothetical protein